VKSINSDPPMLEGYVYSPSEARSCRDAGGLLSIRLETSLRCDLNCLYCCNNSGAVPESGLRLTLLEDLVRQASELGARSVVIIGGGEPTIYAGFRKLVRFVSQIGLIPVVFTNAQSMSHALASFLYDSGASVIVKMDSLDPATQDILSGKDGSALKIRSAVEILDNVGYLKPGRRLRAGASMVVTKLNLHDIPNVWKFCREHHLFPNMEMLIPNGRAGENLLPSIEDYRHLKMALLKQDIEDYAISWVPYTPLASAGCFQCMYNVYVDVNGWARPCSSIHVRTANIKDKRLSNVIKTAFFRRARYIEQFLTGKCSGCAYGHVCVGCRGLSFTMAKIRGLSDLEALVSSDPSCWKGLSQGSQQ